MKKQAKPTPISPKQPARLTPAAAQAIADYQQWMQSKHLATISINGAISILIVHGWQAVMNAEHADKAAQS